MATAPTKTSPAWPLQKAIYTALSDALSEDVYDHLPQDAVMPFVVIGNQFASDWSTNTTTGDRIRIRIHVFSEYDGKKELLQLMSEVKAELHQQRFDLSADGFNVADARHANDNTQTTTLEDEGRTVKHGIIEFDYHTQVLP